MNLEDSQSKQLAWVVLHFLTISNRSRGYTPCTWGLWNCFLKWKFCNKSRIWTQANFEVKRCSVEAICESSHLKFAHLCNATGHPRHETPRTRCRAQFLHIELHGIREKQGKVSRSQLFFKICIRKGLVNEIQGRLISLQSLPKVSPSTSSIQSTNIHDVQHSIHT